MSNEQAVRKSFANQVAYCRANGAPVTANIVEAIIAAIDPDSGYGRAVLGWAGDPLPDALPLRCAGGFHALYLTGAAPELAAVYDGTMVGDDAAHAVAAVIARHEARLMPWLDGPPQTNETGRSASYIAGLAWLVSQGLPHRFELNEIGSSAGLNLMLDRYRYDLAGRTYGPTDSVVSFAPEWRGPPPPEANFAIESVRGCDIAPVDLADPAQALRLRAYIWPEHVERFARLDAGIAMMAARPVSLIQADADQWVAEMLQGPQQPGTVRVLMHSIVWQYLGEARQERITTLMEAAGRAAKAERPVAWVALEANRETYRHELVVRYWPGDGEPALLGEAHPHGKWIDWRAT
ncbi:MAG: DUF2332 domain-containing protein [Blastomonas sp.]